MKIRHLMTGMIAATSGIILTACASAGPTPEAAAPVAVVAANIHIKNPQH